MDDHEFLNFTRGIASGPFTDWDIAMSGDTRLLGLMLYAMVRVLNATNIVEVGCADGSTAVPLVKAASETGGIVHSIDPSVGGCEPAQRLIRDMGLESHWQLHLMKSDEFFADYNDTIHFAYIDGDHADYQVNRDAENVLSRLMPGGCVIFHDWSAGPVEQVKIDSTIPEAHGVLRGSFAALIGHWPVLAFPILPRSADYVRGVSDRGVESSFLLAGKPWPNDVHFYDLLIRHCHSPFGPLFREPEK